MDADLNPILERSEVYSGVYGRASINLYAFNSNGNRGIACGLNNLQKISDGEPLGGKSVPRMISPPRMTTIIFPETTQGGSRRCRPANSKKMRGKWI